MEQFIPMFYNDREKSCKNSDGKTFKTAKNLKAVTFASAIVMVASYEILTLLVEIINQFFCLFFPSDIY